MKKCIVSGRYISVDMRWAWEYIGSSIRKEKQLGVLRVNYIVTKYSKSHLSKLVIMFLYSCLLIFYTFRLVCNLLKRFNFKNHVFY